MKISEICEAKLGMPQKPNMAPMKGGDKVPFPRVNNLVAKHSKQKGGTHKPVKGKGSYDRKPKHKNRDTDAY